MMGASLQLEQKHRSWTSNRLAIGSLLLLVMAIWNAQRVTTLSMGVSTIIVTPSVESRALQEKEEQRLPKVVPSASTRSIRGDTSKIVESANANPYGNRTVIDFISVGSLIKPDYQLAQRRTFGSHPAVRNFFTVTELNDTDSTCHTDFTMDQWHQMRSFCRSTEGQTKVASVLRTKLFWPKEHTGWMCAQKRPIDGFRLALEHYQNTTEPLPNYLLIIDDDTYVNMPAIKEMCEDHYPISEPHVVTGCRFTWPRSLPI